MGPEAHRVELSIPMLSEMELAAACTAKAVAEFMKLDEDQVEETAMAEMRSCCPAATGLCWLCAMQAVTQRSSG